MDTMFHIRGPQPVSNKVVIVDIDEKSLKGIGQWPWPRNIMADLTTSIQEAGAKVTGFDIVFAEKDRTSPVNFIDTIKSIISEDIPASILSILTSRLSLDYDELFGQAAANGKIVLGYAFQLKNDGLKSETQTPFPSGEIILAPLDTTFNELALKPAYRAILNTQAIATSESEGFFNIFSDSSGMVRKAPLLMEMDGIPYPSLAFETFRLGKNASSFTIHTSKTISAFYAIILGISIDKTFIPTNHNGEMLINYRGPFDTFQYISAIDVINKKEKNSLKDKYVLIGTSAAGLFDLRATPFSSAIPGIEINATIIDNLLQADPFTYDIYTEIGITYILLVIGGIALTAILSFSGPTAGVLGAILFFLIAFAGNYHFFFLNNQYIGITYPIFTCGSILILVTVFNYFYEGRAKRYIQKAFSHYVAPEMVSKLINNPETLSLKGEEKELTVLFSDIKDFTTISEKMDSKSLGSFMNKYLTQMSQIIMNNGGTVDKFIGDAIMAFWGAPNDDPKHAEKAVKTALLMKKNLKRMNNKFKKRNLPEISIRIGINTGMMSVGNFGSNERFDYTVMGDHVNLASRLENINKEYGTMIIISQFTYNKTKDSFKCRYLDSVTVKGKEKSVEIYEPVESDVVN